MYFVTLFLMLALAGWLAGTGFRRGREGRVASGAALAAATLAFFWFMGFWGEKLWFDSVGYTHRFWKAVLARGALTLAGGALGWLTVWLFLSPLRRRERKRMLFPEILGAASGALWGLASWDVTLRFFYREDAGIRDPLLGRDVGFYLFTLPWLDSLLFLFLTLALLSFLTALLFPLAAEIRSRSDSFWSRKKGERLPPGGEAEESARFRLPALYAAGAFLAFTLAFGLFLRHYHLLFSDYGVVRGPGWTDAHVRLPAYWFMAFAAAALGFLCALPPLRRAALDRLAARWPRLTGANPLAAAGAVLAGLWLLSLVVVPALFQWLRVQPNEISMERPYLVHNIAFTRLGFGLQNAEVREIRTLSEVTSRTVEENRSILDNVRLWDPRALLAVYKQFQEIRLYYEFSDVDIDRYPIGEATRQVMVSAREMDQSRLPDPAQTFVNRRFKYTHGFGITLAPVNEFTRQGLPNLLIQDIPPRSETPSLEIEEPRIYYGELTTQPVVVNSREPEFDFPKGEENVFNHYSGRGGVVLSNLWRKILYGWKFDGSRLLLSGYPHSESRILFHRDLRDRVKTLAPFLILDADPYIVMEEGRLFWIQDCYLASNYFPYSEPFSSRDRVGRVEAARESVAAWAAPALHGRNYVRNSVKAVIDAYHGSVDFYVFEPEDPLVRVWGKIFPGLFQPRDSMPPSLLSHIRYPEDLLLTQGLVYAKYHMEDPAVFYNQEDLWRRATEKYYDRVIPVDPYYIMWKPQDMDRAEFSIILPFTPKDRQVLIGWIAGLCDPANYGRFLVYKFPKEMRVIGPQQVDTKIDQDPVLSMQLPLWDQHGSRVIRGNVLAIPMDNTLLYVEPIYIQAEAAAYPELRLVVLMHQDNFSYGESFDQALEGLLRGEVARAPLPGVPSEGLQPTIRRANLAFENYLSGLGAKRYQDAAQSLQELEQALQSLMRQSPPAASAASDPAASPEPPSRDPSAAVRR